MASVSRSIGYAADRAPIGAALRFVFATAPPGTRTVCGTTFQALDPRIEEQIGYALPWWNDDVRAKLLAQVRAP